MHENRKFRGYDFFLEVSLHTHTYTHKHTHTLFWSSERGGSLIGNISYFFLVNKSCSVVAMITEEKDTEDGNKQVNTGEEPPQDQNTLPQGVLH